MTDDEKRIGRDALRRLMVVREKLRARGLDEGVVRTAVERYASTKVDMPALVLAHRMLAPKTEVLLRAVPGVVAARLVAAKKPAVSIAQCNRPALCVDLRKVGRPWWGSNGEFKPDEFVARCPHHSECACARCSGGEHVGGCFCGGTSCKKGKAA